MKKILEKLRSLSGGTIVRTVLQVLVYINQFVAVLGGIQGFADSMVYQIISVAVTMVVTAVSYWYNNDWSKAAQLSGEVFDMIKDGNITQEELKAFLDNHKGDVKEAEEQIKE